MDPNEFLLFLSQATLPNNTDKNFDVYKEGKIVSLIKTSNDSIRTCFFPSETIPTYGFSAETKNAFFELAVKYICYGIHANVDEFHFYETIQNCPYSVVGGWFQTHGTLGPNFLQAFLQENGKAPTDPAFQNALCQVLVSKGFIAGEWIRNVTESPDQAKLVLAALKLYMPDKYDMVTQKWSEYFPAATMEQLKHYSWFDKYESVDILYENYLKSSIKSAIYYPSNYYDHNESGRAYWSGAYMYGQWEIIKHHEYDRGAAVLTWLNSGQPAQYGMRSSASPHNHVDETKSEWHTNIPGPGCVSPGTKILLADGKEKPICEIKPGDQVLSEGETVSICSDEIIHNDKVQVMYGINEWEPFLSFEHALMTQRGWCSLNPLVSNRINPYFHIGLLEVGDTVTLLSHDREGKLFLAQVLVEKITAKIAKPGTYFEGYDLHFREGKNSYFANGLLCLLNYPEMTLKRIKDNMSVMTETDRNAFVSLIQDKQELFTQVFGEAVMHQFEQEVAHAKFENS